MPEYNYEGSATDAEKRESIEYFEKWLGSFLEEFDQKGGTVVFNYNVPKDSPQRISFNLLPQYDVGEFIYRFKEYHENQKREE